MNSIIILKSVIDALYDEMKDYKDKTDKRIKDLENELSCFQNKKCENIQKNIVVVDDSDDDDAFVDEASAPPTSSSPILQEQEENKIKSEENDTMSNCDIKNIKMVAGKDRKEYMKEYQRNYRKKQKNNLNK